MVLSVPQETGTLLESNTLEEIILAFEYHVEAWKQEFLKADSNEKIADTIMEPLVLRYRVLQKLMINIKSVDKNFYQVSRVWKLIGDDMWRAHNRYKKEHGQRYNVDMAASRVYQEEDFPIFPPKPTQSVENEEPSDCLINEDQEHLRLLLEEQEQLRNSNEAPTSSFVYSIAEDGGNECEKPFQASADVEMHHEPIHESIFNEENVSPSGASFDWIEHHSDPPIMISDGKENAPKVNVDSMSNFSVDKPLHAHVSDPPDAANDSATSEAKIFLTASKVIVDEKLAKLLFPHKSDPPIVAMEAATLLIDSDNFGWMNARCVVRFWLRQSCYYTPSSQFHRWRIKLVMVPPKMNAKIVSIVDDTIFLAYTFSVRTCQALSLINF